MSGRDEQGPIHKEDHSSADHGSDSAIAGSRAPWLSDESEIEHSDDSAAAIPPAAPPAEDLIDEPVFYLPAIPIEPNRPINGPVSRVLTSGDDLLEFARDPFVRKPSKPAQRDPIPDDLDPALFARPLPSDPDRLASRPRSAFAPADRLTAALSQQALPTGKATAPEPALAPDFPITPIAPFAQGASSLPLPSEEEEGDQQHQISPILDTRYPTPDTQPEPESRIPNFLHILILLVIASLGFLAAGITVQVAFHFHLWGVKTIEEATNDVRYTLASMAVLYAVSFAIAFFLFPILWQKPFFAGLQWNFRATVYTFWRPFQLFAVACFCFILAMVDELILPGPTNAPIDKMFSNTSAAWLLFGFGVLVAPFFEEITFRGFLLPALCTACDWVAEYIQAETRWSRPSLILGTAAASSALAAFSEQKFGHHSLPEWILLSCFIAVVCGLAISWLYHRHQVIGAVSRVRPLGPNGHPQWSIAAMIIGSLLTSLPFAAMHADQIANSLGPLVLLYCVSLVLCFARLSTRSLAASTLVHASYNFLLFSLMLIGTSGFKHLDKM